MKLNNKLIDHFKNNRNKINSLCVSLLVSCFANITIGCGILCFIDFERTLSALLGALIDYPIIILMILISTYKKEYKNQVLLPVLFGVNLVCSFFLMLWDTSAQYKIYYYIFFLMDGYIFFLSLRGFNILKGKMTLQIYCFAKMILEIIVWALDLSKFWNLGFQIYLQEIVKFVVMISWYIICALFVSANKFKDFAKEGKLMRQKKKMEEQEYNNIEKELEVLKEKFELGCIGEEEYELKREEIINRVLQ